MNELFILMMNMKLDKSPRCNEELLVPLLGHLRMQQEVGHAHSIGSNMQPLKVGHFAPHATWLESQPEPEDTEMSCMTTMHQKSGPRQFLQCVY